MRVDEQSLVQLLVLEVLLDDMESIPLILQLLNNEEEESVKWRSLLGRHFSEGDVFEAVIRLLDDGSVQLRGPTGSVYRTENTSVRDSLNASLESTWVEIMPAGVSRWKAWKASAEGNQP